MLLERGLDINKMYYEVCSITRISYKNNVAHPWKQTDAPTTAGTLIASAEKHLCDCAEVAITREKLLETWGSPGVVSNFVSRVIMVSLTRARLELVNVSERKNCNKRKVAGIRASERTTRSVDAAWRPIFPLPVAVGRENETVSGRVGPLLHLSYPVHAVAHFSCGCRPTNAWFSLL